MNYTIARMEDVHGNIILDVCADGNKYTVGIWNKETKTSSSRRFDDLKEAYKIFEKISSWIVFGYYSDKDRETYLTTGAME